MTMPITIQRNIHFDVVAAATAKRSARETHRAPTPAAGSRAPSRPFMALAIRFDQLVRAGQVADYAELARLGHVTRADDPNHEPADAAADIQEQILFLPRIERGRDPIHLGMLQPITQVFDWRKQRQLWGVLVGRKT